MCAQQEIPFYRFQVLNINLHNFISFWLTFWTPDYPEGSNNSISFTTPALGTPIGPNKRSGKLSEHKADQLNLKDPAIQTVQINGCRFHGSPTFTCKMALNAQFLS